MGVGQVSNGVARMDLAIAVREAPMARGLAAGLF
jgi:hypothetical protein